MAGEREEKLKCELTSVKANGKRNGEKSNMKRSRGRNRERSYTHGSLFRLCSRELGMRLKTAHPRWGPIKPR